MARCASCNARFWVGGTARHGQPFCDWRCADRADQSRAIARLDPEEIEAAIQKRRAGPCPVCHGPGPVGASPSVRVIGFMHAAVSETRTHVGCAACMRRGITRDLLVSLLALASIGMFFVPRAIWVAAAALTARHDEPSQLFRFAVAKALVDEHARAVHDAVPLEQRLGGSWT